MPQLKIHAIEKGNNGNNTKESSKESSNDVRIKVL